MGLGPCFRTWAFKNILSYDKGVLSNICLVWWQSKNKPSYWEYLHIFYTWNNIDLFEAEKIDYLLNNKICVIMHALTFIVQQISKVVGHKTIIYFC